MNAELPELTPEDREIWEWQMWIRGFGDEAQRKLKGATVFISRLGGVGGLVAYQLAAAGVGRLILAHGGEVRKSDLNRQLLMTYDAIGKPRMASIQKRLLELNPKLDLISHPTNVSDDNVANLMAGATVAVDAAPLFHERMAINRQAIQQQIPLVECSMYQLEAELITVLPGKTACLRCVVPVDPPTWKRQFPVLGAVSGAVACLGATEVVKLITGIGKPLAGRLLRMDLGDMSFRTFDIERRENCEVCGSDWHA